MVFRGRLLAIIGGVPRFCHITDYMRDVLHWLPVQQRIHYRIASIVWHCVLVNAPAYLLELFILSWLSARPSNGDSVMPLARTATRQKRVRVRVNPNPNPTARTITALEP